MADSVFTGWVDQFSAKLMAPEDAAMLVQPGDCIVIPIGVIAPTICRAIWERREELAGCEILACAPYFDPGWFEPGDPAFATNIEIFTTLPARASVTSHRTGFISVPFSRRFKYEEDPGRAPAHAVDVAIISVSPPDRFGFCSFGTSMWNKAAYARRARVVLAEMYSGYPRTGGANRIHVSEIDAFVEGGTPPPPPARERPPFPPSIAAHVNELIRDGDTIQIGTGAMTAQLVLGGAFQGKEDLGVHSEISVPGMNELVRIGVFNGARKTLHPGKYVATALIAQTPDEVEFIHENPIYEVYDVEYTNDVRVIAAHDNMVAINNAMAVDFAGQVASESVGADMWSGPGGQFEFAMGALMSRGGRSITVLPSTAKDGAVSRIVAGHPPGTPVTVPRQIVDYVVTEWGIARLYGKSDRERAAELIAIAHPDHRADLRRQAGRLLAE